MYIYICTDTQTRIYTHNLVECMYIYTHMYMYVCMYAYIYIHIHVYICIYMLVCLFVLQTQLKA